LFETGIFDIGTNPFSRESISALQAASPKVRAAR